MNILVVDDEREIADIIEIYLRNDGHNVYKFYNGKEAIECVKNEKLDLAILDVMMPEVDGLTILKFIRENHKFPVLMVTAKTDSIDQINGLTLGADDYIAKPFNPLELSARVKAHLRRATQYNEGAAEEGETVDIQGISLNRQSHECSYNGDLIILTPIEFQILWTLGANKGKVISSQNLFESIWKEKYSKSCNNTVMVHIRHLREKIIKATGRTAFIKTVWGVGYKIED